MLANYKHDNLPEFPMKESWPSLFIKYSLIKHIPADTHLQNKLIYVQPRGKPNLVIRNMDLPQ